MERLNLYFILALWKREFSQDYKRYCFCDFEAFALNHYITDSYNLWPCYQAEVFYIFKHLHKSFQMNVFYNLESKVFSQKARHAMDEEAFLLDVKVTEDVDHNHMRVSICTR